MTKSTLLGASPPEDALIGGGAVGAKAEITASVPAGVHWRASPDGMPLWGPNRIWPGSGLILRCRGPGFTVLALGSWV